MSDQWFYDVNGQASAPVTKAMLGQMLSSGQINRQTQVIREGIPDWTPLEDVPELRDICVGGAAASASMKERYLQAYDLHRSKQYDQAMPLLQALANEGCADAMSDLGFCYQYGEGVTQDEAQSEEWYRKAIDQYLKAAAQGDADAQFSLGISFTTGQIGVAMDRTKAAEWYLKAAEQGHKGACSRLGFCYEMGDGVPQDYAQSAKWYRKAAAQGDKDAQKALDSLKAEGKI